LAETLNLVRQLQPDRPHLHVVVDGTTSGQADLQTLRDIADRAGTAVPETLSVQDLSWAEYQDRLNMLDHDDALLLLSAYRDREGISKSFAESLAFLIANAQVPIFHLWEHGLGSGIVGGILVSHHEQGRQAGLIARRILSGEDIASIPVLTQSPNIPMFDYRALQRFGIDYRNLPAGAHVLFEPETLWKSYRYEITALVIVLALLLVLSAYLARQNFLRTRLARDLRDKSGFLRLLMDTSPDMVWMKDTDGVYQACNRRFEAFFGAREAQILGRTDFDFVAREMAERFRDNDRRAIEHGGPIKNEERVAFASDGHSEVLETIKTPVVTEDGSVIGVLAIARDITARRAAEEEIRKLSLVVEQSPVSVMITDKEGNIEYVNRTFEQITGYRQDEVLGQNPRLLKSGDTPASAHQDLWSSLKAGRPWEGEMHNRRKNGELFWEYAHIAPVVDDDGSVQHYFAVKEDITLRKQQNEKILYQAHYDALTRLPNRLLSLDRLQQMMSQAKRQKTKTAVLFIDLDDFKKVNDSLGHDFGDKLLIEAAKRLQQRIRAQDSVGRLGGDEFIVLLGNIDDAATAAHVAQELIQCIRLPFRIDHRELLMGASVGIAVYPDNGDQSRELLRKADTAMYQAKRSGGTGYSFFTNELDADVSRRFAVEEGLHVALARKEFHLLYQPQIDIRSQKIVGAEALLRWDNPTLGRVAPDEFIPIAEQTGTIVAIGRFVLETAIREAATLCAGEHAGFRLAVNVSPRQFRDEGLVDIVESSLQANNMPPRCLEIEITEGLFIEPDLNVGETLRRFHDAGITLSMDDFGTGYSSLSYLRLYPFDKVKIDREFVRDMTNNAGDRELVFAAISMAHSLGLTVVAEGVEHAEQSDLLLRQGCETAQGFLYSPPISISALRDLARTPPGQCGSAQPAAGNTPLRLGRFGDTP
jgi:diguanylate cyclase (GGDEF)-like protein/PAS domain S-box-containing protein